MSEFLTDDFTKQVIDFSVNTGHAFDPQKLINKKGAIEIPKDAKEAYLIFLLEARKLQRIELESVYDPEFDRVYGGYVKEPGSAKDAPKKLKRWVISSVTTQINLTTPDGIAFFEMCCVNRFVAGTKNAFSKPYFRIEIPELRAQSELTHFDAVEDAIKWVGELDEEGMNDLAIMLNILNFAKQTVSQKRTILRKYAINDPKKIVEVKNNKDSKRLIMIHKAVAEGVIKQHKGVFRWADYDLGLTKEQVLVWMDQNEEVAEMITNDLERKLKNSK